MKELGIEPNVFTYVNLLKAYLKHQGDRKEVQEKTAARYQKLKSEFVDWNQNILLISTLVDALIKDDFLVLAMQLYDEYELPALRRGNFLDLHGFSHGLAYLIVLRALQSLEKDEKLNVITGIGHHSKHEQLAMKNYIIDHLNSEKAHLYSVEECKQNEGMIQITCS